MSSAFTIQPNDDERVRVVTVRHLGRISLRVRLPRGRARALAKAGMDPAIDAAAFRNLVLENAVEDLDVARLTKAGRHRVALAVLRVWGAWSDWSRLYGSQLSIEARMHQLLVRAVRDQARPRTLGELQDDLQSTATIVAMPAQRAAQELGKRLQEPARAMERALEVITAPLREAMQRLQRWRQALLEPLRLKFDSLVRTPAVRHAAALLTRRIDLGRVDGPVANLLRVHRERRSGLDGLLRPAPAGTQPEQREPTAEIVLPDDGMLIAFFARERGDPAWRKGPLGWLLRAVPIPLGAAVHDRLQESSEAALAWLAERLLRRELRRVLEPALTAIQCEATTREVLLAGVDHYLRREWAPADTLLTAGLDGLLLDLAFQQGVVTDGQRLRREDGKPGRQMRTAGQTKLLASMGFDGSQIAYLTSLSLGPTGNPPRHGSMSPIGSDVHAAGSLLGLLLVLSWASQERPLVARALIAA